MTTQAVGGCTWPEQDAVNAWAKKHGVELSFKVLMELKEAVTAYRITRDRKLDALAQRIAELNSESEALRHDITRHVQIAADQANRIAELERENKELHAGDNLKAIVNEDTRAMFENCVGLSDEISNLRQRLSQAEANLIAFREAVIAAIGDLRGKLNMESGQAGSYHGDWNRALYAALGAIRNLELPPAAEKLRAVVEAARKYVAEFERNHKRSLHNDRHGIVEAVRQLEKEG
jgi:hypothetical protein